MSVFPDGFEAITQQLLCKSDGYFYALAFDRCLPCASNCKACYKSPENCVDCPSGWHLETSYSTEFSIGKGEFFFRCVKGSNCPSSLKKSVHPVSAINVCSACHPTCETCNGPLLSQCLSCISGLNFSSGVCKGGYFNAYRGGMAVTILTSPFPALNDADYTVSAWFFPRASSEGQVLSFGSLGLRMNPLFEMTLSNELSSKQATPKFEAWNHLAVSLNKSHLALQLSLNGKIVDVTSPLTYFMKPVPLTLGGTTSCNCDLAHVSLLTKAIRAVEFDRGLMYSILSNTSYYYQIFALYTLTEGAGLGISAGDGLDAKLTTANYWMSNSAALPPMCYYDLGEFKQSNTCNLCSASSTNCKYCYSEKLCIGCNSSETSVKPTSRRGSCSLSCSTGEYVATLLNECVAESASVRTNALLSSDFRSDPQVSFPFSESLSVWTVEFWLKQSNVSLIKPFLSLDTSWVQSPFSWRTSSATLRSLSLDYEVYNHFTMGYDGEGYFLVVNKDSPIREACDALTIGKLVVELGQGVFALKDLRVWSEDVSAISTQIMDIALDPGSWPTLVHYWKLYGSELSNSLTDLVTLTTTDLLKSGGLTDASYITGPESGNSVLCEANQFKSEDTCMTCNPICAKGCNGTSESNCISCKLGFNEVEGKCIGAKMWNSLKASEDLSSSTFIPSDANSPWTLDFFFKIKTASSSKAGFLQVTSSTGTIDFLSEESQVLCSFSSLDFTTTIETGSWVHAAFVSSNSKAVRSKCYINFIAFPKQITGFTMATSVKFLMSPSEVFVGMVKLNKLAIEGYDLEVFSKVAGFPLITIEKFTFSPGSSPMFAEVEASTIISSVEITEAALYCGPGSYQAIGSNDESVCLVCSAGCLTCTSSECLLCDPFTTILVSGACTQQTSYKATTAEVTLDLTDKIPTKAFSIVAWVYKGSVEGTLIKLAKDIDNLQLLTNSEWVISAARGSQDGISQLYTSEAVLANKWAFLYLAYDGTGASNTLVVGTSDTEGTTTDPATAFAPDVLWISGSDFSNSFLRNVIVFNEAKTTRALKVYRGVAPTALNRGVVLFLPLLLDTSPSLGRRLDVTASESALSICEEGYRASEVTGTCVACEDSNCISCDGATDDCDTCKEGYGSVEGSCALCESSKKCTACDGSASTCSDCSYGMSVDSSSGSCKCPVGKWLDESADPKECKDCYETCETCADANTCETCGADPMKAVGTTCKYYGVLASDQIYADFKAVCINDENAYTSSQDCDYYLRSYCCDFGTSEYESCRSTFDYQACRPCTFYDQQVCDDVETLCWTDYTLNDPSSDACLKAVYSYCCSNPTECADFSHSFQCSIYKAPVLKAAVYSPSYKSFTVTFDRAVYSQGFDASDCLQYFAASDYYTLGIGAKCEWTTNYTQLLVSYGSGATFTFGPLSFKANTIKSAYKYATSYGSYSNIAVNLNDIKPKPTPDLNSPMMISYCSDLEIDGTSSAGGLGRNLELSWNIFSNSTSGDLSSYVDKYRPFGAYKSITLPKTYLTANTVVTSMLTARNFIGETASVSVDTFIRGDPIPYVTFLGGNKYSIFGSSSVIASVSIEVPSCMDQPQSFEVEWELKTTNYTGTVDMAKLRAAAPNDYSFYYKPGLLKSNYTYVFTAKVTGFGSDVDPSKADLFLTLYPSVPIVVIQGGNRKATASRIIELSGSDSNDPDDLSNPLDLVWTCSCIYGACLSQVTGEKLTIYPNELKAPLTYNIVLTGKKGNLVATFTSYLQATDKDVPYVSIKIPTSPLNPSRTNTLSATVVSSTDYTIAWSQMLGNTLAFSTSLNQNSIMIAKDSAVQGQSYMFKVSVSVSADSEVYLSYVQVKANSPPCCGKFTVTPARGYELKTVFTFLAEDWEDVELNYPLTYSILHSFGGVKSDILLSTQLNSNIMKGNLSLGYQSKVTIVVQVYDSLSAMSSTNATVTVDSYFSTENPLLGYVNDALDEMLADIDTVSSYVDLAFNLSSLCEAAMRMPSDYLETDLEVAYTKMVTMIASVYTNYNRIPNISILISSMVKSMTQNPLAMNEASRTRTLSMLNVMLSIPHDYMSAAEMQNYMDIISNLIDSNLLDSQITYANQSDFQLALLPYLVSFGSSYMKNFVSNMERTTFNATSVALQMSRNSPDFIADMKFAFSAEPGSASLKMPERFAEYLNTSADSVIDSFFTVTEFKPYMVASNKTVLVNDTAYVGHPTIVEFRMTQSGTENSSGQVDLLSTAVPLHVTGMGANATINVPIDYIGSQAMPNCTWLNETGKYWTRSGCYVISIDSKSVTCNCTHFTQFTLQQSGEDLADAAQTANIDEAINIQSLKDLNMATNAIGLYTAATIIFIYIILIVFLRRWDRSDNYNYNKLSANPALRLKIVLNRHKHLYTQMLEIEEQYGSSLRQPKQQTNCKQRLETHDVTFYDTTSGVAGSFPQEPNTAISERGVTQKSEAFENANSTVPEINRIDAVFIDPDEVTQMQQKLLLEYGLNKKLLNFNINLEEVKPDQGFMYKVYINAYVPNRKTLWEIFVLNYPVLELIFLVKPNLQRVSRLTVMIVAIMGRLFTSGLFYNTKDSTEAEDDQSLAELIESFSIRDFWIAILSAFIVLPICWVLHSLFDISKPARNMTPEEIAKVERKNRIKTIIAYGLSWSLIAIFSVEITIFAIQFNQNVSSLWSINFAFSSIYDFVVQGNFVILLKYLLQMMRMRKHR